MKVIGLTGRIGCGKSTVAAMLAELGVAVVDADAVAREVRGNDEVARSRIQGRFGTLDPDRLAAIVFADDAALADLEAILHPPVRDFVVARLEALAAAGVGAACVEAIKLLESPLRSRCDEVWAVACRETDAIARLAGRGMPEAAARARLANQAPQAVMVAAATRVIDGSAQIEETRRQVAEAYAALMGWQTGSGSALRSDSAPD